MGLLRDFTYYTPGSLKEALGLLKKLKSPLILGGGTFVLNYLKKTAKYPSHVLGLKHIASLRGIKDSKKAVTIGAMVTIAEVARSSLIKECFPALADASGKVATTPLRHMATIGGNLASRFFWVDLPAVLMALGAEVTYATAASEKTVPVGEFLENKPRLPHILTKVTLPKKTNLNLYFRHTRTMDVDFPVAALAFSASVKQGRCADVSLIVNPATSFPRRLERTSQVFEGSRVQELSLGDVKESLRLDLKEAALDEYRRHCLEGDLEALLGYLKKAQK